MFLKFDATSTVVVCSQWNRAKADGYPHMSSNQKLTYLYNRGEELLEERRKRMAVEDVQEEWIIQERAKAVRRAMEDLHGSQRPSPSQVQAEKIPTTVRMKVSF